MKGFYILLHKLMNLGVAFAGVAVMMFMLDEDASGAAWACATVVTCGLLSMKFLRSACIAARMEGSASPV
jgi:hypothetical protein